MSLAHRIFAQNVRDMRRMPPAEVEGAGAGLLARLLLHAAARTESYRALSGHLNAAAEGDARAWASIPILTLDSWRGLGARGLATDLPEGEQVLSGPEGWITVSTPLDSPHGRLAEIADIAQWEFLIHDLALDTSGRMAAILPHSVLRPGDLAESVGPWSIDSRSGRAHRWSDRFDAGQTLTWLEHLRPEYLFSDPGSVDGVLAVARERDVRFATILLRHPAPRSTFADECRDVFGSRLAEAIASPACGFVASAGNLRGFTPALETCRVEIVDEAGLPCGPGQPGRLLATALYAYHRPVIRLDLGLRAAWLEATCTESAADRRRFRLLGHAIA